MTTNDLRGFLSKQDPLWDRLPTRWEEAPFVGNGLTGTMVYWDAAQHGLRWVLGRSDVGRLDFPGKARNPIRIQIGTLLQRFPPDLAITACAMRIDLWNAEVVGRLETNRGTLEFRLLAPTGSATFLAEFRRSQPGLTWAWEHGIEPDGAMTQAADRSVFVADDYVSHPRTEVASGGFAVVWGERPTGPDSTRMVCSIGCTPVNRRLWHPEDTGITARAEAEADFDRYSLASEDAICRPHRAWWHHFYQTSFFSFSDREMESLYWIQLYKFASSSRPDRPMIDNHGIWSTMRGYAFSTWDFNVQTTYRTPLAANLENFGRPFLRFMEQNFNRDTMWDEEAGEWRAGMRQQTFLRYRFFDRKTWEHPNLPCDGPGKYLWGVQCYSMYYRHSRDRAMLPRLMLMLEAGINAMQAGMRLEEDGLYHIPHGDSWESWMGRDPVGLFCVLNWALETAIELGPEAGVDEAKVRRWQEFRSRTVPYARNEKGLMLGEGQEPLRHRHWTQLMMLYPLDICHLDNPEEAQLLRQSIDLWARLAAGLGGDKPEAGFSPPAALSLYAYLFAETGASDADLALIPRLVDLGLHTFTTRGASLWPATMYREFPGPVMETPFFIAVAVQECLLQSRRSGIHVFPAVPADWPEAVFSNWHAEGNVLVSARRTGGKTDWIAVKSLSGGRVRLHTDLEPGRLHVNGNPAPAEATPDARRGRCLIERDLKAGETLLLSATPAPALDVRPVERQFGPSHPFGLNATFLALRPHFDDSVREFDRVYAESVASLPENKHRG